MSLRLETTCVDCQDPIALGRWWAELLAWKVTYESDEEVVIESPEDNSVALLFGKVPETKTIKNRLHFDLRPDDRDVEVARAEAMGARRVDIGQGEPTWVVLGDPEGNEFCILRAPRPDEATSN